MRILLVAVMLMQAPSVTITPPLLAGETFRVQATHVIKYYLTSDGTTPCASTPPGPNCIADTTSYQLQVDGKVLVTQGASMNVDGTVTFTVTGGLPAGTHTAVVDAVGSSPVPSAPVTFVIDPLPVPLPSPQGAPLVQIPPILPPSQWAEITTLRGTSATQSQKDTASLATPTTVPIGTWLIVAGGMWAQTAPTSVVVTGSGTGCSGLKFTIRIGTALPVGVTWRTFTAFARTTVAGPCTVTVNPAGTLSDFSWSQTGFSGPATVTSAAMDCTGNSTAPSCTLAGQQLVIGVLSHDGATMALTATSGTAIGELESNAGNQAHAMAYTKSSVVSWSTASATPWSVQLLGLR